MLYEFWSGLHESPKKQTFEQNIQSQMMTKSHRLISCLSTLYSRAALGEPAFPLVSWVYKCSILQRKGIVLLTSNSGWLLHPRACIKKKRHLWFFSPCYFHVCSGLKTSIPRAGPGIASHSSETGASVALMVLPHVSPVSAGCDTPTCAGEMLQGQNTASS